MSRRHKPSKDAAALVLSPFLYLGPRTSVTSTFILSNNITHVLSIGATPVCTSLPIVYHRLSLPDDAFSSITKVSDAADAIIEAAKPGKILVHCSAAISRSPTIVAAYLMKKHNMNLKDALGLLVQARPAVCPNAGFFSQLKELETRLTGTSSLAVDVLPARKDQRLALFVDQGPLPTLSNTPLPSLEVFTEVGNLENISPEIIDEGQSAVVQVRDSGS